MIQAHVAVHFRTYFSAVYLHQSFRSHDSSTCETDSLPQDCIQTYLHDIDRRRQHHLLMLESINQLKAARAIPGIQRFPGSFLWYSSPHVQANIIGIWKLTTIAESSSISKTVGNGLDAGEILLLEFYRTLPHRSLLAIDRIDSGASDNECAIRNDNAVTRCILSWRASTYNATSTAGTLPAKTPPTANVLHGKHGYVSGHR